MSALLLFVFATNSASAQSVSPDPVQFIISPEAPRPHDTVVIEVQGVGTFLGDATITWQRDGKTVKTGVGEKTFSFTAGGLGVRTLIHVVIDSSTYGLIVRDFAFVPSLVNVVWEAHTSVPPLFLGKALYSGGSSLTITAFPTVIANGKSISSNNFSFQWTRNGNPMPAQSGKGKVSFTFQGDQLRNSENVGVAVYLDGTKVGSAEVNIPATKPLVVLYSQDPLRGVLFERALPSAISLASTEISLLAQPYFFSNQSIGNDAVTYTWVLNGKEIAGPESDKGLLTLRQEGSGTGSARLSVELQNNDTSTFVQSAKTGVQILFGQQSNSLFSSFFGL